MKKNGYLLIPKPSDWPGRVWNKRYVFEHQYVVWKETGKLPEKGYLSTTKIVTNATTVLRTYNA